MTPNRAIELANANGCRALELKDAPGLKPWGLAFERRIALAPIDGTKAISSQAIAQMQFGNHLLEEMTEARFVELLKELV